MGKLMKFLWTAVLVSMIVGCTAGQVKMSPESLAVQFGTVPPPEGAIQVAPITARHGGGCGLYGAEGNFEGAAIILRNKAATMGANYVQILRQQGEHMTGICLDRGYTIDGMAYQVVEEDTQKAGRGVGI